MFRAKLFHIVDRIIHDNSGRLLLSGNAGAPIVTNRIFRNHGPQLQNQPCKWFHMSVYEENDHRRIGPEQNLFFTTKYCPGSFFFKPDGAHVYNTLVDFLRKEYRSRGIRVVRSPMLFKSDLWKISGHLEHYSDDIYQVEGKEEFSLKPMNCPGHCLIYKDNIVSWRDLPLRFADFGALHRDEVSGALSGLTRVREFHQDDAHIFCRAEQMVDELAATINFVDFVYKKFGFTYELSLSTRPESYMGELQLWNEAEDALRQVLDGTGQRWKVKEGDGAFYGPKVDITLTDAKNRAHQCATIQLDFQLPKRFDLAYICPDGSKKTPVMIHRAIFGSIERFMGIITENFLGHWPFWLSPRQAIVLPANYHSRDYATKVEHTLFEAGFEVSSNIDTNRTVSKRIKMALLDRYNFIIIVGEKESQTGSVAIRRGRVSHQISVDKLIEIFERLKREHTIDYGLSLDDIINWPGN